MPPKPIASVGCDTTLFLCKKLTFQTKIYTHMSILFHFLKNFLEKIYFSQLINFCILFYMIYRKGANFTCMSVCISNHVKSRKIYM